MKPPTVHRIPVHQQIAAELREEITAKLRPGDLLDAESKLAERFQVSVHTVREALSVLAHDGLLDRRHGRGTFVADQPRRQHLALWLAIDAVYPHPNYWSLRILGELQVRFGAQDIPSRTYWTWSAREGQHRGLGYDDFLHDLSANSIAAIGVVNGAFGNAAERLIRRHRVPVVNGFSGNRQPLEVRADRTGVVRQGARRLLEQGCRRIAWLQWADPRSIRRQPDAMREIFRTVLAEYGVAVREQWIGGDLYPAAPGAGYAGFREIWAAAAEKPDGLLVTDDLLLPDVVTAIRELGIAVPRQLKVVATANKDAITAPLFPAARMEYDPAAAAGAIGDLLIKLVKKQPIEQRRVTIPFHWRETRRDGTPKPFADDDLVEPPNQPLTKGSRKP